MDVSLLLRVRMMLLQALHPSAAAASLASPGAARMAAYMPDALAELCRASCSSCATGCLCASTQRSGSEGGQAVEDARATPQVRHAEPHLHTAAEYHLVACSQFACTKRMQSSEAHHTAAADGGCAKGSIACRCLPMIVRHMQAPPHTCSAHTAAAGPAPARTTCRSPPAALP